MGKANSAAHAIELRRGEIDRVNAQGAQFMKVTGDIEVDDIGETVCTVSFPCYFSEKPFFTFGPELASGVQPVSGQLPTCHAVVTKWQETVRDDNTNIYSGATISIVTSGPAGQAMIVQWHMEGTALRGPVPNVDD